MSGLFLSLVSKLCKRKQSHLPCRLELEIRIWSMLLIKSDLKWCIHISRSLFSYRTAFNPSREASVFTIKGFVKSAFAKMGEEVNFSMIVSKADFGSFWLLSRCISRMTHKQFIQRFLNFGIVFNRPSVVSCSPKKRYESFQIVRERLAFYSFSFLWICVYTIFRDYLIWPLSWKTRISKVSKRNCVFPILKRQNRIS